MFVNSVRRVADSNDHCWRPKNENKSQEEFPLESQRVLAWNLPSKLHGPHDSEDSVWSGHISVDDALTGLVKGKSEELSESCHDGNIYGDKTEAKNLGPGTALVHWLREEVHVDGSALAGGLCVGRWTCRRANPPCPVGDRSSLLLLQLLRVHQL